MKDITFGYTRKLKWIDSNLYENNEANGEVAAICLQYYREMITCSYSTKLILIIHFISYFLECWKRSLFFTRTGNRNGNGIICSINQLISQSGKTYD